MARSRTAKPVIDHVPGDYVRFIYSDRELFRYRYRGSGPELESPRPVFHPIRTLSGNTVTADRPWDHRWHRGLSMTSAELSGTNFWGGPTYVRDQGYVMLANHGRQNHATWEPFDPDSRSITENLRWHLIPGETAADFAEGSVLIEEKRSIGIGLIDENRSMWILDLCFDLRNVSGKTLEFGSPTTNGRPGAGYGGLFWRAPREFRAGTVSGDSQPDGESFGDTPMGRKSGFLAYTGHHDEIEAASTLLFIDSPANPRYPTQWFVRTDPEPYVSAAFMFDEIFPLPDGQTLSLSYRIAICDGALSWNEASELASELRFDDKRRFPRM